jgi:NAD(P)H-dependent flavin oxidoreductase YrpB (nitropropane dioxygenase family)
MSEAVDARLQTRATKLFGCRYPIVQTGMGWVANSKLTAATSSAGGLGILASAPMTFEQMVQAIDEIKSATDAPFGVNMRTDALDIDKRVDYVIKAKVPVASFAQAPGEKIVKKLKDAGIVVMPTIGARRHAEKVAAWGVDAVIAQGQEGGGHTGFVPTTILVPQVLDAVDIPVLAAGGIFDGRGLAAALMLGAVGVNIGTRFVASAEAPIDDGWRQAIVTARSEDTIKAEVLNALDPNPGAEGFGTVLRSLRTPFLDEWNSRLDEASARRDQLLGELKELHESGRSREVVLTAGQSAGAITEVLPVAEIIRRLIDEAEAALQLGLSLVRGGPVSARKDPR